MLCKDEKRYVERKLETGVLSITFTNDRGEMETIEKATRDTFYIEKDNVVLDKQRGKFTIWDMERCCIRYIPTVDIIWYTVLISD